MLNAAAEPARSSHERSLEELWMLNAAASGGVDEDACERIIGTECGGRRGAVSDSVGKP